MGVDNEYDNLRILLNHYGPFDWSKRAENYADQCWPGGWPVKVWCMFVKAMFTRNQ